MSRPSVRGSSGGRAACSTAGCRKRSCAGASRIASASLAPWLAGDRLGLLAACGRASAPRPARSNWRPADRDDARRRRSASPRRESRAERSPFPDAAAGKRRAGRWCRARPRPPRRSRVWPASRRAGRSCRCSPSAIAGDRRGSARAAGRRGSPPGVAWPRMLRFQTLSSPISIGMLRAIGASRKCASTS